MARKIVREQAEGVTSSATELGSTQGVSQEWTEIQDNAVTIPINARILLEVFHNYDELYVDRLGGLYTKDTKPELRGAAILYKNPYYKS